MDSPSNEPYQGITNGIPTPLALDNYNKNYEYSNATLNTQLGKTPNSFFGNDFESSLPTPTMDFFEPLQSPVILENTNPIKRSRISTFSKSYQYASGGSLHPTKSTNITSSTTHNNTDSSSSSSGNRGTDGAWNESPPKLVPFSNRNQSQKRNAPTRDEQKPSREWKIVYRKENAQSAIVEMKTRKEKPKKTVDENLYSSLKYEFYVTANGLDRTVHILKMDIVYGDTCETIPPSVTTSVLLKGDSQKTMQQRADSLKGNMKVQFSNDLSYHKLKRTLRYELSIYRSDKLSIGEPEITLRSPSFKVYCRKPDTKFTQKRKKRTHHVIDNRPIKKLRLHGFVEGADNPELMKQFCDQMHQIFESIQNLNGQSRNKAVHMLMNTIKGH